MRTFEKDLRKVSGSLENGNRFSQQLSVLLGKSICSHSSEKESLRGVPYVGIEVGEGGGSPLVKPNKHGRDMKLPNGSNCLSNLPKNALPHTK